MVWNFKIRSATGKVTRVDTATPNRVRVKKDSSGVTPVATQDVTFDVRKITGAVFLVRFLPQVTKTFKLDVGLKFLDFKADLNVNFGSTMTLALALSTTSPTIWS